MSQLEKLLLSLCFKVAFIIGLGFGLGVGIGVGLWFLILKHPNSFE